MYILLIIYFKHYISLIKFILYNKMLKAENNLHYVYTEIVREKVKGMGYRVL